MCGYNLPEVLSSFTLCMYMCSVGMYVPFMGMWLYISNAVFCRVCSDYTIPSVEPIEHGYVVDYTIPSIFLVVPIEHGYVVDYTIPSVCLLCHVHS